MLLPEELRTALSMASSVERPSPAAVLNVRPRLKLAWLREAPICRERPLRDKSLAAAGWPAGPVSFVMGAGRAESSCPEPLPLLG